MDRRHGQDPLGSKLVFLEVFAKMGQVTFGEVKTSSRSCLGLRETEVVCGLSLLDLQSAAVVLGSSGSTQWSRRPSRTWWNTWRTTQEAQEVVRRH